MKLVLALWWLAFPVLAGEGPCPVPDLPSDLVTEKVFHPTAEPVRELKLFGKERRLLLRSGPGKAELLSYDPLAPIGLLTGGFAVFPGSRELFSLASLEAKALPSWFERAETVFESERNFVGAVWDGRYRVFSLSGPERRPAFLCAAPPVPGLRLSGGSRFPWVYFHAVGKRHIRLFRMNLSDCGWEREGRLEESLFEEAQVFRFPDRDSALVTGAQGVIWWSRGRRTHFDLFPTEILQLSAREPRLLLRTANQDVRLLYPERPGVSTILTGAVDLEAAQVAFSPEEHRLFIAGTAQGADRGGVYELRLAP